MSVGALSLVRLLNLRHAARHKVRTALTIAGIAAGVALVFSISIINATLLSSFRSSLSELAGHAEIEVASADQTGLSEDAVARVASVPGVDRAVPVLRSISRLEGTSGAQRTLILGITPEFASLVPKGFNELAQVRVGGGFGPRADGLLLAASVGAEIGATSGGIVRAETPRGAAVVAITGSLSGGGLGALNGGDLGVMLLPAAQRLFDKVGVIDSIYVVTDQEAAVSDVEAAIDSELRGAAVVGPPGERGRGLERIFEGIGTLLTMAGAVALFVALFVVYNTMSMALSERRREISMALSFGASRRQLFAAFLMEGTVLGMVASMAGLGGGLLLARVLIAQAAAGYEILPVTTSGPVVVTLSQAATALVGGLVVSLLGAFLPARRVATVAPIESLRPEASYEWSGAHTLGLSKRASLFFGLSALVIAVGFFVATVLRPDARGFPIIGIVVGMVGITLLLPLIVPLGVVVVRIPLRWGFGTVGRLSADALAKNPGRTTFTVAALVLTLGMVVGVGSALGSYKSQVEAKATALIGAPLYVTSKSYAGLTSDQPLPGSLRAELASVDGVSYVYPLRFSLINAHGRQALMYAVPVGEAIERGAITDLSSINENPEGFLDALASGGVAVSRTTAERYGLEVGDLFELPTPTGKRAFEVGAVFEDLLEFDSLYIAHDTYARVWQDDMADEFGILLEPDATIAQVEARLDAFVDANGVPARVYRKEELLGRLLQIIEGTFSLGRGIQLAALVVAALTIANTLFTAVLERRWEMGLQRALGMGRRQLSRSVLLEAAGIGVIGGGGGLLLGVGSGFLMVKAMEAQYAWRIPFDPPLAALVVPVVMGVAIAAGAGVIPSRLAVRPSIIETLRYE